MESGNVRECWEQINAYCNHAEPGHALLVNAPTYNAYHEILNRLLADGASKERVSIAEHCLENGLPQFDDILPLVSGAGCFVLTGLSQAALLRGSPTIHDLIGELFQMPVRGHAVVLLEHMREHIERYLNLRHDTRLDRQFILMSGAESPLPRLRIANPIVSPDALPNMRSLFQRLEKITDEDVKKRREIFFLSPFTSMAPFCDSLYSVKASDGVYASLAKQYPDLAVHTKEDYGSETQWIKLAALLDKRKSFAELAKDEFEEMERSSACLADAFESGDSDRTWLLWLSMKILGVKGNRYLSAAVENSVSVKGLQQDTFQRAVIVSDHGASRLAVIYAHESAASIQLDEKAEHSGRCSPAETDPQIPFAAWENGFAVLANYERFRGGRKAKVKSALSFRVRKNIAQDALKL